MHAERGKATESCNKGRTQRKFGDMEEERKREISVLECIERERGGGSQGHTVLTDKGKRKEERTEGI